LRRIFSVLAVLAVMVALVAASAMPALAQGQSWTAPNCEGGNNTAFYTDGGQANRNQQASDSLDKNNIGIDKNLNAAFCYQ